MSLGSVAKQHRIDLTLKRSHAQIDLSGDIDILAEPSVRRLFQSLEQVRSDVCVNLAAVTFMDCAGLKPLIEATRIRSKLRLGPLVITSCSVPVLRLLDALGIDGVPVLDVQGWDSFAAPGSLARRLQVDASGDPHPDSAGPHEVARMGSSLA
jgi:anti-anti-sigma factor